MIGSTGLHWETLTAAKLKEAIDKSIAMGLTEFAAPIRYADAAAWKEALQYADLKRFRLGAIYNIKHFGERSTFPYNLSAQNRCLDELRQIVEHLDLPWLEFEEPHMYHFDESLKARDFMNVFFQRASLICHNNSVKMGVNTAGSWPPSQIKQGIDIKYLSDNGIIDFYAPQLARNTLQDFINTYNVLKNTASCDIIPYTYVTYSNLTKQCPGGWNEPRCWNQAFFEQLAWCITNKIQTKIFTYGKFKISSVYFPGNTLTGNNVGEKVEALISAADGVIVPPIVEENPELLTTEWEFYTNGTGNLMGNIVTVQQPSSNTQINQEVELEPNTDYVLSGKIITENYPADLTVSVIEDSSPYGNLGAKQGLVLDATTGISILFRTPLEFQNPARVMARFYDPGTYRFVEWSLKKYIEEPEIVIPDEPIWTTDTYLLLAGLLCLTYLFAKR